MLEKMLEGETLENDKSITNFHNKVKSNYLYVF